MISDESFISRRINLFDISESIKIISVMSRSEILKRNEMKNKEQN